MYFKDFKKRYENNHYFIYCDGLYEVKNDDYHIADFLYSHAITDIMDIMYVLEYFGVLNDANRVNDILEKYAGSFRSSYIGHLYSRTIRELKDIFLFRLKNDKTPDEIIDFFVGKNESMGCLEGKRDLGLDMMKMYYILVPDNLKSDPNFISNLLTKYPQMVKVVYEYISKDDIHALLDKHYIIFYKYGRYYLSEDELQYIVEIAKKKGGIFLTYDKEKYDSPLHQAISFNNSDLIDKARSRYGKSYIEWAKKHNVDPNDDAQFIRVILQSTSLRDFYSSSYFTKTDLVTLESIVVALELSGINCDSIRTSMYKYMKEVSEREISMCNYLFSNSNNHEKINEMLDKLKITKDNFFNYIKDRKFLDKKLKESALLILAKHFNTSYISIGDIIDLLQEMNDRDLTIDAILKEKAIDKKLFYKIYDQFKEDNPEMYAFISECLNENKIKGFKKLIKLYYMIMDNDIDTEEKFITIFGCTPEEMVYRYTGTPFYDEIANKLAPLIKTTTENKEGSTQTQ